MIPDDDDDLLDAHFLGTADEVARGRLQQRLEDDAGLRLRFVQRVRFEAALHRACASTARIARPRRAPRRFHAAWLVAAGIAVAAGLLALVVHQGQAVPAPVPGPVTLAAVPSIHLVSGVLADVDGRPVPRIHTGSTLMVVGEEDAVVGLADGSEVRLAAASQAVFHPAEVGRRGAIDLHRGRGSFTVAERPGRMEVITPTLRVSASVGRFSIEWPSKSGNRTADVSVDAGQIEVEIAGVCTRMNIGERRQFADPEQGKPNHLSEGTSVAFTDGHLQLRPGRGEEGPLESHALADGAVVTIDGQPGAAGAIPAGTRIRYALDAEGRLVSVAASGMVLHARIENIEDDERLISLLSGGGRLPLLLPLAARAVVTVDGAAAELGQVQIGDRVRVQLSVDGTAILGLAVWRKGPERDRRVKESEEPRSKRPAGGF